jgi:hypothetical protein
MKFRHRNYCHSFSIINFYVSLRIVCRWKIDVFHNVRYFTLSIVISMPWQTTDGFPYPLFWGTVSVLLALLVRWCHQQRRSTSSGPRKWRCVGELSELAVYPIKSCAGISLQEAECTEYGIQTVNDGPLKLRDRFVRKSQINNYVKQTCKYFPFKGSCCPLHLWTTWRKSAYLFIWWCSVNSQGYIMLAENLGKNISHIVLLGADCEIGNCTGSGPQTTTEEWCFLSYQCLWCDGSHLHRDYPEKTNTESMLSCCSCTLVEGEKPHPVSYRAAATWKENCKGEKHNRLPRDPLRGSSLSWPHQSSPTQMHCVKTAPATIGWEKLVDPHAAASAKTGNSENMSVSTASHLV